MFFQSLGKFSTFDFWNIYDSLPGCHSAEGRKRLAELLDVTPTTLQRYIDRKATPPKAYVRLMFWESDFGRSTWTSKADQHIKILAPQVNNLTDALEASRAECAALALEIQRLKADRAAPDRFIAVNDSYSGKPPTGPAAKRAAQRAALQHQAPRYPLQPSPTPLSAT